jgi:hypothetical protein
MQVVPYVRKLLVGISRVNFTTVLFGLFTARVLHTYIHVNFEPSVRIQKHFFLKISNNC